ncbi:prospero homeobox protein 2 [Tiliqua scincoides]|uniref:prospero homeobox protein 2 n=1 Tax=Tiliqua scincoides TaxID=71010 RepID=UPI003462223D
MNRNTVPDQYNFSPGSGHASGQKGQPWIDRERGVLPPASYYASIISHLLSQPEADCELDPSFLLPSTQKTELLFQSGGSNTPSREASFLCQLPVSSLSNSSQFQNEHLQAKRARVEHIIQGMSIMPHPSESDAIEEGEHHQTEKEKKSYRENRRKQKLPQQQSPHETSVARSGKSSIQAEGCLQLEKQLHLLQCQLELLQERFLRPCELSDSSQSQRSLEKTKHFLKKLGQSLDNSNQCAVNDYHKDFLWRTVPRMGRPKLSQEEAGMMDSHIQPTEEETLSEILKHELVQVVTQAVDSVLKKVWSNSPGFQSQLCNSPSVTASSMGNTGAGESTPQKWLPRVSSHKGSMSLITDKAPGFSVCSIHSKLERKPCQVPHVNYPLIMSSEAQGNGILSQMLLCDQSGHWGRLPPRTVPSPESVDMPWQPIKWKSSVRRHQQCPGSYKSADMESLTPLSGSNTECAEMHAVMDGLPFPSTHVQDALTPGHLKKAKLMFFFTRYPTSSLLKAYFLDVQFTRCITSQLIKWFSNFREFYYIQMEKFARQALLEGVMDPNSLIVSRTSELFRILNIHYNKGNDFEVPDGFLNVANLTLQEFFNAIRAGKDLDPSWKKPIYKIISKLDSEIPDAFKSSSCLQELTHHG